MIIVVIAVAITIIGGGASSSFRTAPLSRPCAGSPTSAARRRVVRAWTWACQGGTPLLIYYLVSPLPASSPSTPPAAATAATATAMIAAVITRQPPPDVRASAVRQRLPPSGRLPPAGGLHRRGAVLLRPAAADGAPWQHAGVPLEPAQGRRCADDDGEYCFQEITITRWLLFLRLIITLVIEKGDTINQLRIDWWRHHPVKFWNLDIRFQWRWRQSRLPFK